MNPKTRYKKEVIEVNFGKKSKFPKIIYDPLPHILVDSNKKIHGWWNSIKDQGKRACTSERLLINPYNGCSWDCFFCYSHALWGYFELFRKEKIITVFKDFDKIVDKQLSKFLCASCGYISPTTDPFQPINNIYHLTEKIMRVFLKYDVPVEVITKGIISDEAIKIMAAHPYHHSFGQVTILTLNDDLRKKLVIGKGASSNQLIKNFKRLSDSHIHAVCRIDPIIPFINDNISEIKTIIDAVVEAGAKHIGTSILDIPIFIKDRIFENLARIKGNEIIKKYKKLYNEKITSDLHANIIYRKRIFKEIKRYCNELGITMSTCMEFEIKRKDNQVYYESLNNNNLFMTSNNCEGIDIPIYTRKSLNVRFKPVNCKGDCLYCNLGSLPCKIPPLQEAKNWKLKDYMKWNKYLEKNNYKILLNFIKK